MIYTKKKRRSRRTRRVQCRFRVQWLVGGSHRQECRRMTLCFCRGRRDRGRDIVRQARDRCRLLHRCRAGRGRRGCRGRGRRGAGCALSRGRDGGPCGRGQEGNTRGGVGCDTAVTVFWSPELELEVVGRLRQRAPSPRSSLLPQLLPPPSSDKLPQQRGTLLYISP